MRVRLIALIRGGDGAAAKQRGGYVLVSGEKRRRGRRTLKGGTGWDGMCDPEGGYGMGCEAGTNEGTILWEPLCLYPGTGSVRILKSATHRGFHSLDDADGIRHQSELMA